MSMSTSRHLQYTYEDSFRVLETPSIRLSVDDVYSGVGLESVNGKMSLAPAASSWR